MMSLDRLEGRLKSWICGKVVRRSCRKSYTIALIASIGLSFVQILNIPVFWPLLVMYFIMVMLVAFKTKIAHMIRYRYLPIDIGKRRYTGKAGKK